jgi:hypothetical protein
MKVSRVVVTPNTHKISIKMFKNMFAPLHTACHLPLSVNNSATVMKLGPGECFKGRFQCIKTTVIQSCVHGNAPASVFVQMCVRNALY